MSRNDLPEFRCPMSDEADVKNFDIEKYVLNAMERAWEEAGRQIADNFDRWIIEETNKEYRRRKKNRKRRRQNSKF